MLLDQIYIPNREIISSGTYIYTICEIIDFILHCQKYKTTVNYSLYLYLARSKSESAAKEKLAVIMISENYQTYIKKG